MRGYSSSVRACWHRTKGPPPEAYGHLDHDDGGAAGAAADDDHARDGRRNSATAGDDCRGVYPAPFCGVACSPERSIDQRTRSAMNAANGPISESTLALSKARI